MDMTERTWSSLAAWLAYPWRNWAKNIWSGSSKLLFIVTDLCGQDWRPAAQREPVKTECAYVSFCYEIKLETSAVQAYAVTRNYV